MHGHINVSFIHQIRPALHPYAFIFGKCEVYPRDLLASQAANS
jgi:hypothetical protein